MRILIVAVFGLADLSAASAQFDLQNSEVTASLRGIDSTSPGVAWASGSEATVLRTEDGGFLWQRCVKPKGGETLDFRGVQGFDAQTAVVMSSGKGDLSRIYKTTDGCQTWKLVFTSPDADSFFDSMRRVTEKQMYLLGDPVGGKFQMFYSPDRGSTWYIADDPGLDAVKGDGAFAASNSALTSVGTTIYFGSGGSAKPAIYRTSPRCPQGAAGDAACPLAWVRSEAPMAGGAEGAGVFSLAGRTTAGNSGKLNVTLVAVGGDYKKPDDSSGTAARSTDEGRLWSSPSSFPHGYRSAVVFDRKSQAWLAVGPNGTDTSQDDGKTWKAVPGETAAGWNAISLPFVVGSKGRIGKVRDGVLEGK